jgi:hypothetical protein
MSWSAGMVCAAAELVYILIGVAIAERCHQRVPHKWDSYDKWGQRQLTWLIIVGWLPLVVATTIVVWKERRKP